jgi:hypothetical protein
LSPVSLLHLFLHLSYTSSIFPPHEGILLGNSLKDIFFTQLRRTDAVRFLCGFFLIKISSIPDIDLFIELDRCCELVSWVNSLADKIFKDTLSVSSSSLLSIYTTTSFRASPGLP